MSKLNEKQKLFIKEYLKDFNGTKSAIRSGYSKKSAKEIAYENLTKPHIQKAIKKEVEKLEKKIDLQLKKVIEELQELAFSDISNFVEFNNNEVRLKDSKKIDKKKLKTIETIIVNETDKGIFKKLKLHSKINALSRLLDYIEYNNAEDDSDRNKLKIQLIKKIMKT